MAKRRLRRVDAQTGEVLQYFNTLCKATGHEHAVATSENPEAAQMVADGPATATAKDLFGVNRTVRTYQVGGTYFLIDASRPMFNLSRSTWIPCGGPWKVFKYATGIRKSSKRNARKAL